MPDNVLRCPRCRRTSTMREGAHCHCAYPPVEKIDLRLQSLLRQIFSNFTLGGAMIGLKQIGDRINRLDQLFNNFQKEVQAWQEESPLSADERKNYLDAIYSTRVGVARACMILSKARARIEKEVSDRA